MQLYPPPPSWLPVMRIGASHWAETALSSTHKDRDKRSSKATRYHRGKHKLTKWELNLIIIGLGKVSTDVVFQQVLGKEGGVYRTIFFLERVWFLQENNIISLKSRLQGFNFYQKILVSMERKIQSICYNSKHTYMGRTFGIILVLNRLFSWSFFLLILARHVGFILTFNEVNI